MCSFWTNSFTSYLSCTITVMVPSSWLAPLFFKIAYSKCYCTSFIVDPNTLTAMLSIYGNTINCIITPKKTISQFKFSKITIVKPLLKINRLNLICNFQTILQWRLVLFLFFDLSFPDMLVYIIKLLIIHFFLLS